MLYLVQPDPELVENLDVEGAGRNTEQVVQVARHKLKKEN